MILCPFVNTPTHVRKNAAVAQRHQLAALVLCLCIANDMMKLVQCGAVKPGEMYNKLRSRHANDATHAAVETIYTALILRQKYAIGVLVGGATVDSPTSDPSMLENVKNSHRRTGHTKAALKILCRIVRHKTIAQVGTLFRSRLLHKCVQWKYKHASHEAENKQGRLFHTDSSVDHTKNNDMSVSVRWKAYSETHGGKKQKISYRRKKNARRFLHHRRIKGRSKRAVNKEAVAMATDTYDAQGITLTPRTFYTIYNKSSRFVQDKEPLPAKKVTTPTNSPPSPHLLRTSDLSEWKTVSLEKTHSNSTPPGDIVGGHNVVTSLQSPVSIAMTTDMEQTTTPLSLVNHETSTDHVTTETSMVTSTASPADGSTHYEESSAVQTITKAEPDPQNSTHSFSMQNATTQTVNDERSFHTSTTVMLPNITTDGTNARSGTQSETFANDNTTTTTVTTAFDNHISTTNQVKDMTYDVDNATPSSPTTTIETTKGATTITISTTSSTTTTTTPTTKMSHPTTTTVMITEATTHLQSTQATTTKPTTIQVPSVINRNAKNVTNAHMSSATIAGITTGSLAIFWLFLGPIVCLVCHLKDRAKKRRKRQTEDEMGHRLVHELIRCELAKGRGQLYKTVVKDDHELEPLPPETNGAGVTGRTCVTVV
ncbi:hypothetical protein LSAT2_032239 [Lamellibrachia satsuma]|nr:hypothetical protein LSAT2_032239 [Lamellibrachia satsuma]